MRGSKVFQLFAWFELFGWTGLAVLLFVRTVAALVLIMASVPKLISPAKFVQIIQDYQLLPDKLTRLAGYVIPLTELSVGLALFSGITAPWPSLFAALLFGLFGGAICVNLLRGRRYIDCGCFGAGREAQLSWRSVLRNVILAFLALLSMGTGLSLDCLRLRGCGANPLTILAIDEKMIIVASGFGVVSLWWLSGLIRYLLAFPTHQRLDSKSHDQDRAAAEG
jgi:uncharacterized membrane protein YphA (DoxX/SURF4 family)